MLANPVKEALANDQIPRVAPAPGRTETPPVRLLRLEVEFEIYIGDGLALTLRRDLS